MSTYFRIRLLQIPDFLEDVITQVCFDFGATGLSEALAFTQQDITYDPDVVPVKAHDLDVFFTERPKPELLDRLRELVPSLRFQILEEEHKDWLEEWKKGFEPFKLVADYWVVPSWREAPPEAKKPLRIDPGMAFGTGTHATTQIAASLLHRAIQADSERASHTVLDVGTGTAILALLADKENMAKVVGLDIDPEARRVARENILRNESRVEIKDQTVEEIKGEYDYVVANIIDGVLLQLRPALIGRTRKGGQLFLTGILSEREDDFFNEFMENTPLKVVRRVEKEEWVGYWMKKES
ncbi:MAG: 50S ribosomal protein L11 methyltransferase [Pseudobdellovibrionaceae bacterium]